MELRINAAGIALIKVFEGLRLKAYLCPAGYLTNGYGHVMGQNDPTQITELQADDDLRGDLDRFEKGVNALLKIATTQNQFSALVSFAYNLGLTALAGSTLLRLHNGGRFEEAAAEFLKWNKARVKGVLQPLAGLTRRRAAEQRLYQAKEAGL